MWEASWAGEAAVVAKNRLESALGSHVGAHRDPFGEGGLRRLSGFLLLALLSGLMVAWFLTRSLGLVLLGLVCMHMLLVHPGFVGGEVMSMCFLPCLMEGVRL